MRVVPPRTSEPRGLDPVRMQRTLGLSGKTWRGKA